MKQITMKAIAAAVFAAGLAVGMAGTENAQAAACVEGATKAVVNGNYIDYYRCRNGGWVWVRRCLRSSGICLEP